MVFRTLSFKSVKSSNPNHTPPRVLIFVHMCTDVPQPVPAGAPRLTDDRRTFMLIPLSLYHLPLQQNLEFNSVAPQLWRKVPFNSSVSVLPSTGRSAPTFPPPGWYFMLSVDPILERTFFRSGVGALMGLGFRGARGTGGFFSIGVCLGTGGLVMTRRRWEFSPLVEATGVAGVAVGAGRRAAEREKQHRSGVKFTFLIPTCAGPNLTFYR